MSNKLTKPTSQSTGGN